MLARQHQFVRKTYSQNGTENTLAVPMKQVHKLIRNPSSLLRVRKRLQAKACCSMA